MDIRTKPNCAVHKKQSVLFRHNVAIVWLITSSKVRGQRGQGVGGWVEVLVMQGAQTVLREYQINK